MSQNLTADMPSDNNELKPLYAKSLINSFSFGTVGPFLGVYGLVFGLQIAYALSAIGRGVGALTFTMLKEPREYPSTLRKEFREIVQKLPLMPERGPVQP